MTMKEALEITKKDIAPIVKPWDRLCTALEVSTGTSGMTRKIIDILSDAQVIDDHTVCDFCKYKGICGSEGDYDCNEGIALAVEEKLEVIK